MIIQVSKSWRIRSDSTQWIVEKYRAKKDTYVNIGYYITFDQALSGLADRRVREIDSSEPSEILRTINAIHKDIKNTVRTFTYFTDEDT